MSKEVTIRLPQYRVLKALRPHGGKYPAYNRVTLAERAGFRGSSGTINRALHGIKKGSSSGDPFKGLLDLGFVRPVQVPVDGASPETAYQSTAAGQKAAQRFEKDRKENGRKVGEVRDAKASTNARYTEKKPKAAKKSAKKAAPKPAAKAAKPKAKPAKAKAAKKSPKKAQPKPVTPAKAGNPAPVVPVVTEQPVAA